MEYETYRYREAVGGLGTFFYTDCGNRMYSVCGPMIYHGKLCPKCWKTLYIRGSKEAISILQHERERGEKNGPT